MRTQERKKKVLAIVAASAVLGLGAAVTLAAWTDQEWLTGTVTSGGFDVESSLTSPSAEGDPDDTGFSSHLTSTGALSLTFSPNSALSPEDKTFEEFWVRTSETSTTNAKLSLSAITAMTGSVNNANQYSYDIFEMTSPAACTINVT